LRTWLAGVLRNDTVARVERLPPPPREPVRSPPVEVAGEVPTRVVGLAGGPSLEARVRVAPAQAVRGVVICHPHPLYGGSMHSPVPLAIAKCLSDLGGQDRIVWLRFNFRGVGASEGSYDDARGEVDDALAAIEHVARLAAGAPVAVCGHSFGSFVGLNAAARDRRVDRVLLLAPSVRLLAVDRRAPSFTGATTIFVGDRDDFCDVDEARALATELRADLRILEGNDHHFLKSRRAMAEMALPVICPEVVSP
jgi:uncharacterized protein